MKNNGGGSCFLCGAEFDEVNHLLIHLARHFRTLSPGRNKAAYDWISVVSPPGRSDVFYECPCTQSIGTLRWSPVSLATDHFHKFATVEELNAHLITAMMGMKDG